MTFISYAQNYEDVMLWRALKHVQKGFYIDVGAAWPEEHSVTKAFYDRGWMGINIEPNPTLFVSLNKHRGRDINLQVAIGEFDGKAIMNFINNSGLSTLDKGIAIQHETSGWSIRSEEINVQTLSNICSSTVPFGQDIHFLKIDIEGSEKQALISHDWVNYRPWIVLVEATLPMTQQESFQEWEPILLRADYVHVYSDGLNRFYVAKEQSSLIDYFKYPPNVFDAFVIVEKVRAEDKAQQAQQQAVYADAKAQQAQQQAVYADAKAQQAEVATKMYLMQLDAVYRSKSWRITSPLRWMMSQLQLLQTHGFKKRVKSAVKKALARIFEWILVRPKLKSIATQVAYRLGLTCSLKSYFHRLLKAPITQNLPYLANGQAISPRAKYFHETLLQLGMKKHNNET